MQKVNMLDPSVVNKTDKPSKKDFSTMILLMSWISWF